MAEKREHPPACAGKEAIEALTRRIEQHELNEVRWQRQVMNKVSEVARDVNGFQALIDQLFRQIAPDHVPGQEYKLTRIRSQRRKRQLEFEERGGGAVRRAVRSAKLSAVEAGPWIAIGVFLVFEVLDRLGVLPNPAR